MDIQVREYRMDDLEDMIRIWNQVVTEGNAFPQEECLDGETGREFFASQTYCGVAVCQDKVRGLYILHPNNVGRCGHICNASYAVSQEVRGMGIGEKLVLDCMEQGKSRGFRILQFNAVVTGNVYARRLYERLGFVPLGVIPGGFRMPDGHYEDICLYYRKLQDQDPEEGFLFQNVTMENADQAAEIEQICFSPKEACKREIMMKRAQQAPELFLTAVDRNSGKMAGFLCGVSTEESSFRDEFFTDTDLYDPDGKNIMLLSLAVLPEYRNQGVARELMRRCLARERENGRELIFLTCVDAKVKMYEKMGFRDLGKANSSWGGNEWHEMVFSAGEKKGVPGEVL